MIISKPLKGFVYCKNIKLGSLTLFSERDAHLFPTRGICDLGKHAGHLGGIREFGARVASLGNGPDSGRNSVHKIPTKLLSITTSQALEEER